MSKGSWRRPSQIPDEQVKANWDKLYGPSKLEKMVQQQEMERSQADSTQQAPVVSVSSSPGQVHQGRGS